MSAKQLKPHEQIVVIEKQELDAKMAKLLSFSETDTFTRLSAQERNLIREQLLVMTAYSNILQQRIEIFRSE